MAGQKVKLTKPPARMDAVTLRAKICNAAADVEETREALKDYRTELKQLLKIYRQHGGA